MEREVTCQSELLLTTAQVGMALAGFAGSALSVAPPRADSQLKRDRFRNMIELSLTLAAFGLLPFVPTGSVS
jgi:hypothetical protein